MKNKLVTAMLLITLLGLTLACNLSKVLPTISPPDLEQGSGVLVSEERPISSFKTLSITGGGWVKLIQGQEYKLVIEAEDNLIPYLISEIDGDRLEIGYDKLSWKNQFLPTKKITYTLTVPDLEEIILNGGASIESDALVLEALDLDLNGGAIIKLNNFEAEILTVKLDGGSTFSITGDVTSQTVEINGATIYNAENLKSSNAKIVITGAGQAKVWAIDTLNIQITGLGVVSYYGTPIVIEAIDGVGTINSLGEK